ncbi:MAG: sugar phosphate isomerase/epimerase [Anaerolineae bacterium]|nr:sugar phosphate isomerase/epimerase [Anaerolineae bacterium]
MNLSIQQTLLPGADLSERFQRAAEYGFAGVEVVAWGFPSPMPDHLAEIEKAMTASGLPVSSLCTKGTDDFVHPDPAEREKRLAGLVQMLKLADTLGARGVVALPIRPPVTMPDLSPLMDERTLITQMATLILKSALEKTAGGRAKIFLEPLNRYEAKYLRTVAQAADLCRAVNDPRVQIMADMFHMSIEEADIPASLRSVVAHVGHIHLADSNRSLPGHGHTDFVRPFRALREMNFQGWLALECGVPGKATETLPAAAHFLKICWQDATPEVG